MSERKKIGVRVDKTLWEEFRDDVERRHGQTRGVLSSELENAIRNYLYYGEDRTLTEQFAEFNERLQRVEGAVGAAEGDGGADTFEPPAHTHTPSTPTPTEKPAANTATEKKVAWLAECVRDEYGGDIQEVTREVLIRVVKAEYSFRSDTAKRYVDRLVEYFGFVNHPENDTVLVTEDRQAELIERRREQLEKESEGV